MSIYNSVFVRTYRHLCMLLTNFCFVLKTMLFCVWVLNGFYREEIGMQHQHEFVLYIAVSFAFGKWCWWRVVPVIGWMLDFLAFFAWLFVVIGMALVFHHLYPWLQALLLKALWVSMVPSVSWSYVCLVGRTLARNEVRMWWQ